MEFELIIAFVGCSFFKLAVSQSMVSPVGENMCVPVAVAVTYMICKHVCKVSIGVVVKGQTKR